MCGVFTKLRRFIELQSSIATDNITSKISTMFDYVFTGKSVFKCKSIYPPKDYKIGLIVGPSGSGKSTLLKNFGESESPIWKKGLSVASHFTNATEAQEKLSGVGFNSVPSWLREYYVLSAGEKFRANMARLIKSGACIDEFTSVVDRTVAKACSYAIHRLIHSKGYERVTFASCHYDIIEWLRPTWVYDTKLCRYLPRRYLRCPVRVINVYPCNSDAWPVFREHHYLSANISKSAWCWLAEWEGQVIGFVSAMAFPFTGTSNAWREHRTVVLPDYQGMGFGVRISNAVAEMFIQNGYRYFSKTAHPRMGEYRNKSVKWRPTQTNMRTRPDYKKTTCHAFTPYSGHSGPKNMVYNLLHANRRAYSHEYIGEKQKDSNV